jgi:hypothetical protein
MSKYSELADRLTKAEKSGFGAGATAQEISAAEQLLGIRIGGSYREFLKQFGGGGVGHIEIFGLGLRVPPYLNLVSVTQRERHELQPSLRRELIPIMNDGAGNLYCLDTRVSDEPPIVYWDHSAGADQRLEVDSADGFAAWLMKRLDQLE